ncbi:MAG TPA: nucleotide exchange factor GrpE [Patescibacteria group bacterium]|nr:nucleotide exchange factor GrpE [Patescibacteria group bacterium]
MTHRRNDTDEEILEGANEQLEEEDEKNTNEEKGISEDLAKVQEIASQLENQLKRSVADYQNLQRRVQEEKSSWIRMANKELLLKLFPVLDTLMLAQKHLTDKGLDLSISQFLQVLDSEGVKRIETVGLEFDPMTMEAVTTVAGEEGKVVEEVRAGFIYHDSVLRVAQVLVGA